MNSFSSCTQYDGPAVHCQMPVSWPLPSGPVHMVSPCTCIGVSCEVASSSGPQSSSSAVAAALSTVVSMKGTSVAELMITTLSRGRGVRLDRPQAYCGRRRRTGRGRAWRHPRRPSSTRARRPPRTARPPAPHHAGPAGRGHDHPVVAGGGVQRGADDRQVIGREVDRRRPRPPEAEPGRERDQRRQLRAHQREVVEVQAAVLARRLVGIAHPEEQPALLRPPVQPRRHVERHRRIGEGRVLLGHRHGVANPARRDRDPGEGADRRQLRPAASTTSPAETEPRDVSTVPAEPPDRRDSPPNRVRSAMTTPLATSAAVYAATFLGGVMYPSSSQ